jgi:hypothetical protein
MPDLYKQNTYHIWILFFVYCLEISLGIQRFSRAGSRGFQGMSGQTFTRAGQHFMTGRMIRKRRGTIGAGLGGLWFLELPHHPI